MKLICPTLYSGWKWLMTSNKEYEESKREFLSYLNREKREETKAMKGGKDFENDVRNVCITGFVPETYSPGYTRAVQECADTIGPDGVWQRYVEKAIDIDGEQYRLYGYIDVIVGHMIIDLKRKYSSGYNPGDYGAKSIQHLLYPFCLYDELPESEFMYLISNGSSVWRESYSFGDRSYTLLIQEIKEMVDWFRVDRDIWDAYTNVYCAIADTDKHSESRIEW